MTTIESAAEIIVTKEKDIELKDIGEKIISSDAILSPSTLLKNLGVYIGRLLIF